MGKRERQRDIQSRAELFDFLQSQMQTPYRELRDSQRLESESTLVKSYILEANVSPVLRENADDRIAWRRYLARALSPVGDPKTRVEVADKGEEGFFEVRLTRDGETCHSYLDVATDPRFWLVFSITDSRVLDRWLDACVREQPQLDRVWLWPAFLEHIQQRGVPRGFGLDYDYRKFEDRELEATTYLKMQLWGGRETQYLYSLLKEDVHFRDKVVLSKVRLKEFGEENSKELFALQDIKYTGKFTTRGTDFPTHLSTLSSVRGEYGRKVADIEKKYALSWRATPEGNAYLEGYAMHFVPHGFELPVSRFCDRALDGTWPFRLLGLPVEITESSAIVQVVDLHTGGELSLEIYPDMMTLYLPEGTCGNTVVRFYTNLQHYFNVAFSVEADNGDTVF